MDRWKAEMGRVREEKRRRKRKSQKKEDPGARKGRKVAKHCFSNDLWLRRVQGASWPDERWKIARRCGAKHISKSKCIKHLSFGALLEVAMSKKCTSLWREAHFEVKMYKTQQLRTTFRSCDVEKVHALWREAHFEVKSVKNWRVRSTFRHWDVEKVHAVVARSTFRSQNVKNTRDWDHFWRFRCRFAWKARGIVHLVKREQNVRLL